MSLLITISALSGSTVSVGGGEEPPPTTLVAINATVADELYYNGFPWPGVLSDGTIVTIYKRSSTHAGNGALMLAKSTDGGATWTKAQVNVGGLITCSNLSLNVFSDRIIIAWEEGSPYKTFKFAYSDNGGTSWTSGGSYTHSAATHNFFIFSKPQKLPSGKLLQAYYGYPIDNTVDPSLAGFLQSTDNGATWTSGSTIASQMRKNPAEDGNTAIAAGRGTFTEVCICITHVGASDAATKMVAYLRNEDYGGFTHYYSADGGATWTRSTNAIFVGFETPIYNRPVSMINHSGTMYIICGNRKPGDYGIEYITCTPDQLYANDITNYSTVTRVYNALADSIASDVDFGYPEPFIDGAGQLVIQFYDADPGYDIGTTPDWEDIIQKVIIAAT